MSELNVRVRPDRQRGGLNSNRGRFVCLFFFIIGLWNAVELEMAGVAAESAVNP